MNATENKLTKNQAVSLFYVLLLSCIVSSFAQTTMTNVLPAVMKSFAVSASMGQWLTSAFTLAMGIMIPVTPFLLKRFSTRKLIITALCSSGIGLLLSAIAPNIGVMLVGRVFQAISGGIFVSMTQVTVVQIFPQDKVGSYMGLYGLAVGGAPILAPTLAGMASDNFGWRSIFWFCLIAVLVTLVVAIFAARNITNGSKVQLDFTSLMLSAVGFGGLTLGLDGLTGSMNIWLTLGILLIAVIALLTFGVRQTKSTDPFLSLVPFKNRGFVFALLGSMILYAVMMAGSLILPMYLQTLRGYSATATGLMMLPGSIVMMLASPISGRIYDRLGMKPILLGGGIALFISCFGLSFLTATTSITYITVIYAFRMLAIGLMMMPLVTWGMSELSLKLAPHGSALINSLRTFAGTIGMVAMTSVLTVASGKSGLSIGGVNTTLIVLTVIAASLIVLGIVNLFLKQNVVAEKLG